MQKKPTGAVAEVSPKAASASQGAKRFREIGGADAFINPFAKRPSLDRARSRIVSIVKARAVSLYPSSTEPQLVINYIEFLDNLYSDRLGNKEVQSSSKKSKLGPFNGIKTITNEPRVLVDFNEAGDEKDERLEQLAHEKDYSLPSAAKRSDPDDVIYEVAELYEHRANSLETPIEFIERVWGKYIRSGLVYKDTINRLDKKLSPAIRSYCQRMRIADPHRSHEWQSENFLPPERPRVDATPDGARRELERRRAIDRARSARYRERQKGEPSP